MSKDDEKRLELCECEAREPAYGSLKRCKNQGREQLSEMDERKKYSIYF